MNYPIKNIIVNKSICIRESIKKMDLGGIGIIVILEDNDNVIGIFTDGDFRRAILQGISLEENVLLLANQNFKFVEQGSSQDEIIKIFRNSMILHLPVLSKGKLVDILFRQDYNNDACLIRYPIIDITVVIMAGGKGSRLDPFTKILPKPLIPIGNKTILEIIIDKFLLYHIHEVFISVNHKAKIIKSYFEDINPNYSIIYLYEDKPLGTVGALKQLENEVSTDILLTNCDVIVNADYYDLLCHHRDENNDITLVASLKNYKIPYGVCDISNEGKLIKIKEKPEYDLLVNTGMYVLRPHVLKHIPKGEFFNITDLIENIKEKYKIGIYPISENSWIDVGEWAEYKRALERLKL